MTPHFSTAVVPQFGDATQLQMRQLPRRSPKRGEIDVQVDAASPPLPAYTGFKLAEATNAHWHVEQHCRGRAVLLPPRD